MKKTIKEEICKYCGGEGNMCEKCNGMGYITFSDQTPRKMAYNKPHGSFPKDRKYD